jgi:hypothetical protein
MGDKTGIVIELQRFPTHEVEGKRNQFTNSLMLWGYFDTFKYHIFTNITEFQHYYLEESEKELTDALEVRHLYCISDNDYCDGQIPLLDTRYNIPNSDRRTAELPLLVITELKINISYLKFLVDENVTSWKSKLFHQISEDLNNYKADYQNEDGYLDYIFEILFDMGSGDVIVIFRSNNYDLVMNAIHSLKQSSIKIHEDKIPYIIASYSIAGIHTKKKYSKSLTISATISLSAKFPIEINKAYRQIQKQCNIPLDRKINSKFGKYDFEFYTKDVPAPSFMSLFQDDGPLNPNSSFFHDNINAVSTSISMPFNVNPQQESVHRNVITTNSEIPLKLEFIRKAKIIPEGCIRFLYQLFQLRNQVENIVLFEDFFNDEFDVLYRSFIELIHLECKDAVESGKSFASDSLNSGINLFSHLFQDRIYSSIFLLEGPSTNVKFSGSLTKILVVYSTLIDVYKKLFLALPSTDNHKFNSVLNFFIVIDATNNIETMMLFPRASNSKKERLISVSLNNAVFPDMKTAIPLITHEVCHYLRPFSRKDRNLNFLEIITRNLALRVYHQILTDVNQSAIPSFLANRLRNEYPKEINNAIDVIANKLRDKILNYQEIFISGTENGYKYHEKKFLNEEAVFLDFVNSISLIIGTFFLTYDEYFPTIMKRFTEELQVLSEGRIPEEIYEQIQIYFQWMIDAISDYKPATEIRRWDNLWQQFIYEQESQIDPSIFEGLKYWWNELLDYYEKKLEIGNRESKVFEFWNSVIHDSKILETIDNINDILITERNKKGTDNPATIQISMARLQANPANTSNETVVLNLLRKIYTDSFMNDVISMIDIYQRRYKEVMADFFMVNLLNLTPEGYKKVWEKTRSYDAKNDPITDNQTNEYLFRSNLLFSGKSVTAEDVDFDRLPSDYHSTKIAFDLFNHCLNDRYLSQLKEDFNSFIEQDGNEECKNIRKIRTAFTDMNNSIDGKAIEEDEEFISQILSIAIKEKM